MRVDRTTDDFPIEIDQEYSNDSEGALICPRCKENYLHLTGLQSFGGQDAVLRFECEHCDIPDPRETLMSGPMPQEDRWLGLSLRQHKGYTMACWVAHGVSLAHD